MTYHFVNLVSWNFFINKLYSHNRNIYIDSVSLSFCCKFFGKKIKRQSGVNFYHTKLPDEKNLYLTSSDDNNLKNIFVLPLWKDFSEIKITNELKNNIRENDNIVIGISSPKQDYLAEKINEIFPEKKIYCLGAAVYTSLKDLHNDKKGLTWLIMMLKDFKRSRIKIVITIRELILILIYRPNRRNFIRFLNILK